MAYCRERLDLRATLAASSPRRVGPWSKDAVLQAELAALDAEVRALEVTNWRMLLAPQTALAGPSFASVLKLKGTELQQDLVALIARLGGPTALEWRPVKARAASTGRLRQPALPAVSRGQHLWRLQRDSKRHSGQGGLG